MDLSGRRSQVVGTLPVAASASAVAVLLVLDVGVGITYRDVNAAALASGALIGLAVVLSARHLLLAGVAAGVASLAVSSVVGQEVGWEQLRSDGALPGMAEIGGLALLTCWSLRALPAAGAALVAGVAGAAMAGVVGRSGDRTYLPLLVIAAVLVAVVAVGTGLYLRSIDGDRRRGLDAARQLERLAIARELHDVVAHHVTGIVVQAQAALAVWDDRPAAARDAVAQIEAAGGEAMGSMRRLVGSLRTGEERAPTASLHELREIADRSAALGLPVRLHLGGAPPVLPADLAASVHRIVREAITNAQRHAHGATGVDVHVDADGDHLDLEISDDGSAAGAHRAAPGYGITGMAERVEALGGRFEAGPASEGPGWVVRAELPMGSG